MRTKTSFDLCRIAEIVTAWGVRNYSAFPWRSNPNPWQTLVAEVLLQRTRAEQVVPVFLAFCRRFKSSRSFACASRAARAAITSHLGLHFRGEQLYDLACRLSTRRWTTVEREISTAPPRGIGDYTAAAWLSLHRNRRAVMIDANIARWLCRLLGMPAIKDPRGVTWLHLVAEAMTPQSAFREYNYAVIDFTRQVCTPRAPKCSDCPLKALCQSKGGSRCSYGVPPSVFAATPTNFD